MSAFSTCAPLSGSETSRALAGSTMPSMSSTALSTIRVSTAATPGISAMSSAQALGRAPHLGEHVGEALALVIGGPRLLKRTIGADAKHEGHDAARP